MSLRFPPMFLREVIDFASRTYQPIKFNQYETFYFRLRGYVFIHCNHVGFYARFLCYYGYYFDRKALQIFLAITLSF